MMAMQPTIVHVCRHGQGLNPDHVLYGRLPGYGLSDVGRAMAERLADYFADTPLDALRVSPMQRAQEPLAPIAARPAHAHTYADLKRAADEAMIRAKREGRGRACIYVESKMVLKSNYYPKSQLERLAKLSGAQVAPEVASAAVRRVMADA